MNVVIPFDSDTGILVVGHGSRESEGNRPLLDLCHSIESRLGITPVQPCYLELAIPTIDEGLAALYRRGVTRGIVVPLQLTAGRHVRYDIPGEVGRSLAKLSNMAVCFTKHLGEHPRLADIAESRLDEALVGLSTFPASTEYVLVARGSRDPLVRGEVICWAEGRHAGDGKFSPCFVAMTQPTFEDGLQRAISRSPDRVVVQPHLLFPGRLLQQIHARVAELSSLFPHIEWVSVGALGPDARLVDCVLDFAIEARERRFSREVVQSQRPDPLSEVEGT